MTELIQEFVNSAGQQLRVDRAAGVLRGVKLLGLASRNGRRYREQALAEAVGLYEGAKVNVNHPKGHPLAARDYQERLGVVRNVAMRPGEGLFGNLHFNPKHALAEQLVWDAEHAPENVGLSHNVEARTLRAGGETVVEAIERVHSVDLVADPATTRGLFEQEEVASGQGTGASEEGVASGQGTGASEETVTAPSLLPATGHRPPATDSLATGHSPRTTDLQEELAACRAQLAALERRERIRELLIEHALPLPHERDPQSRRITSPAFLESLQAAPDDVALRRLVEDRAAAVRGAAPTPARSREQQPATQPVGTAADFARAIKK